MISLHLHHRPVKNLFELLGQSENGMTYALGWTLSQSPAFLERLSSKVRLGGVPEKHSIFLQHSRSGFGRTDIELVSPGVGTVVIEAKKGFVNPTEKQLINYVRGQTRISHNNAKLRGITLLTAYPENVAFQLTGAHKAIEHVPVRYISWRTIGSAQAFTLPGMCDPDRFGTCAATAC